MVNLFNYIDRPSPIHRLTGATKFICLLAWSFAAMYTYDTRFLLILSVLSIGLFAIGKIHLKDVSFMLSFTAVFLVMNNILIYVFSPQHGTQIYNSCTYLTSYRGSYGITAEQLFYHLNYLLKYLSTIPIVLLFVSTTNPSEFAASLNRIGVRYSVAYSVALALRYIPDVQQQYHEISQAQQARGIEMSKKAGIGSRLKYAAAILIPLIMSSMEKIDTISNAMELRRFGMKKRRSWYMARNFRAADFLSMGICIGLIGVAVYLNHVNAGRFYNPFVK